MKKTIDYCFNDNNDCGVYIIELLFNKNNNHYDNKQYQQLIFA
ncbi:hypothetical protein [Proteus vulgaris]|nr:hypothetical protein [Proteus vulgaris]